MPNGRTGYEGYRSFSRLLTDPKLLLPRLVAELVENGDLFLGRFAFGLGQGLLPDLHHQAQVRILRGLFVECVVGLDRDHRRPMNFSWPVVANPTIDQVLQRVLLETHWGAGLRQTFAPTAWIRSVLFAGRGEGSCSGTLWHLMCSSAQTGALPREDWLVGAEFRAGLADKSFGKIV